jgi:hypothetical protein
MDERPSDQSPADKERDAEAKQLAKEAYCSDTEFDYRWNSDGDFRTFCKALVFLTTTRAMPSAGTRTIEAEVGKYPMRGDELLAILRGIADDEDKGVDKDRRRGAKWACFRCISAVESWLRCAQSASEECDTCGWTRYRATNNPSDRKANP